ncbi:putative lipoprotein with Yx(FWY)xxD motif [Paraburkholderia sp. WC7.3g]|uniref:Uncharacterized protein n=1 Tax=Paraburkholderia podalyriae TaxID=1938811 RepID=A0ABR7PQE4_9BURK|nr:hypothetical protein [Paraburkholderia podalyriae]MBC8748474.1 hypothetical protein [Paraburkholderia podalyriae]
MNAPEKPRQCNAAGAFHFRHPATLRGASQAPSFAQRDTQHEPVNPQPLPILENSKQVVARQARRRNHYAADKQAGDAKGDGFKEIWHIAKP